MEVGLVSERNRDVEVRKEREFRQFWEILLVASRSEMSRASPPAQSGASKKRDGALLRSTSYMKVKHCRADATGKS